ncbi:hypothetical protein Tco_1493716 [Tanacetum coccineum]
MPNNDKTYDGSDDPDNHLKIFQAVAKVERWPMLTWCHMFNFTLTGSARKSTSSSREKRNLQKILCKRFKAESMHVKGALECMRIFGFMHEITNLELIKCLHDSIPKLLGEMMSNHNIPQGRSGSFQLSREKDTSGIEATKSRGKTIF